MLSKRPTKSAFVPGTPIPAAFGALFVGVLAGCAAQTTAPELAEGDRPDAGELLVVDCLLPSQIRKLGQSLTYLAPRRAIKTPARDCEIRGGEYVSYDRANYATALKVWLPQAKEGDAAAQTYVGEIYEKGLGLQPDYKVAAYWYAKAAEQGYARAQINLGYLYEKGLGVERNITTALNWYRKASGLADGELEFASSVEIASRKAQAQELASLREEVTTQDQETEGLRRRLEVTEQQLHHRQEELALAEGDMEALRVALAEERQGTSDPVGPTTAAAATDADVTGELEAKRRELAEREAKAADHQKQLDEKLQAAEAQQQRLLEQLEKEREQARLLRQQLAQRQADLSERRNELAQTEAERDQARETLARLQANQQSETEASQEIQRLTQVLSDREAMVEKQRQEMASLETEVEQQREQVTRDLRAAEKREQTLQQSLDARRQEIASLQSELNEAQTALSEAREELKARDAQIAQAERELKAERERSAQQVKQASAEADARARELEAQLRQREAELAKQRAEIEQLQVSVKEQKSQVASLQQPTELALAPIGPTIETIGPTIEIIEPPLAVTRGIPSVTLRAPIPELEIIGRVTTPESLLTFRVNDSPASVTGDGLFQVKMPVKEAETPVSVVAVDKSGHRAAVDFVLIPAAQKEQAAKVEASASTTLQPAVEVDFGEYYALVIGNNQYLNLPDLSTAANDATAVAQVLKDKYGFKTELLLNADRYTILSALNRYRETLTEKDNLLIYYAGHGELDAANQRGHWLPVDAEAESTANWISNVAITDILNVMSAKHILVVADSCYSGAMTRSSLARLPAGMTDEARVKWFKAMVKTRTRAVLTSGGLEPVLDAGGGEHSVFAQAFLRVLENNDDVLEGWRLYRSVRKQVTRAAAAYRVEQEPQYAPIQYAGHEAGEFLFLPSRLATVATLAEPQRGRTRAITTAGHQDSAWASLEQRLLPSQR
jgi:hypothetical protein